MPATLKLIFPSTIDRSNPCCCIGQSIHHEQVILDTVPNPAGYTGTGLITIRNNQYDVNAKLSVAGDQIGGNISFLYRRRNTTVDNSLGYQKTSFPSIPILNEWVGLRMNGFGDTGILELSDKDLSTSGGRVNKAVSAVFEATALQKSVIISTDKKEFALSGSDDATWSSKQSLITLMIPNGSAVSTIQFELNKLDLLVQPGSAQIFGKLTSYTNADSATTSADVATQQFSSSFTTSLYNSVFPWSNQWSLVDNTNPSISVVNPDIMLPFIPSSDIQIVVTFKVTGSRT